MDKSAANSATNQMIYASQMLKSSADAETDTHMLGEQSTWTDLNEYNKFLILL